MNVKETNNLKENSTTNENLHAVSHFKHETFDVLQYATDFGTISKESLKRITKWGRNTSRIHLHTTQCHRLGWRSRTYST
ncbi:unnamed protein product [Porites lobata]|uniref:Uncharacterized protein n=1 Tax=Porites lobata TaxID=104759 RepID=A0ABN8S5F3_9CNID|nr:unnamed protein product [Porites lobata]CAH3186947.1 unnamed protein product [Porites lobata]